MIHRHRNLRFKSNGYTWKITIYKTILRRSRKNGDVIKNRVSNKTIHVSQSSFKNIPQLDAQTQI